MVQDLLIEKIRNLKTSLHMHLIIFGIGKIMDKREFTLWLDQILTNFFSNMGHHVKKTVNNELSKEEVKWLNNG